MFVTIVSKFIPLETVYAHCDIPCGIYDPTPMQISAHSILRFTQMLLESEKEDNAIARQHKTIRITVAKEEHGKRIEEEIGTLEHDYFKEEHYTASPELKTAIEDAIKLSIKTRQGVDIVSSQELLDKVLKISEIFYKTKGMTPVRVPSVYPTKGEIVTYKA